MHGRVKVKTTAEQQEAKRLERAKKLKLYNDGTARVFQKRQNGEHDEEALTITADLLAANPDVYTLWNFRKEIFLILKELKSVDDLQVLYENELHFLEGCLRMNPKSYGSWHHRCFVMEHQPHPDWKREVAVCNKYLEYDERNFHCWDYRRFVVKHAQISEEEELEFSTSKISSNFSNYSSWHYRSKLLPFLHPDPENSVGVKEEVLLNEFETVQNAFFTDPDDQSAWFYHRWLLGRGRQKSGFHCVHFSRHPGLLTVSFTSPLHISKECVKVTINGSTVDKAWQTPADERMTVGRGNDQFSSLWILHVDNDESLVKEDLNICVSLLDKEGIMLCTESLLLDSGQDACWAQVKWKPGTLFSYELSAATNAILTQELASCQELHELEPENKWALLTVVLLMKALAPLDHEPSIIKHLLKLEQIDETRKNYYKDLRSKFIIENALDRGQLSDRLFSLTNQQITHCYHLDLLLLQREVNLSDNQLSSLKDFSCLQCAETILLNSNRISSLMGLEHLPRLKELHLKNNALESVSALSALSSNPHLVTLHLEGNPLMADEDGEDIHSKIKALLPQLRYLNGQQPLESVSALSALSSNPHLVTLHLEGNPLMADEDGEDIHSKIKALLPQLRYLNGQQL